MDIQNNLNTSWRHSLSTKIVGLSMAAVFVLMSAAAIVNFRFQQQAILRNFKVQTALIGKFIANIAPAILTSHRSVTLDDYMHEIGNSKDVVYAAVFSHNGPALASYIERGNGYIATHVKDRNELDIKQIITTLNSDPDIIHQHYPILSGQKILGDFVLGLSKAQIEQQLRDRLIETILVIMLSCGLLGFGLYTLLRAYALRPIMRLIHGARRVASGNLNEEVMVETADEFGRLILGFNEMMRHIKSNLDDKEGTINLIQEDNRVLQQKIDHQTHELDETNRQLERLTLHDPLTNLPNRFCVQDNLNKGIAYAKLDGSIFSVIVLDLDRFKEVNDTLGHESGDKLLVEISQRLQSLLRPTDLIGRLGGDEFAILLPDTEERGAEIVAEKIQHAVEPPFSLMGMMFSISASLGIATYPRHGNTTSSLLKAADVAMYQAKRGKQDYCVYNPAVDINSPDRLILMTELRDAIRNNTLELFYQPKLELAKHKIVGVEALLRWRHDERGYIPPAEFIPMAEQSGVIRELTDWVIRTAILQSQSWRQDNMQIAISINLSMYNLEDPDFVIRLKNLLEQSGVDCRLFEFEITESVVMSNPDSVMGVLAKLSKMDVRFSIDDFGTGYSSLSTLKRLRVQEIKIDKSFVMDMSTDKDDEAIVRTIIDMAHTLGLRVTAEGVESETSINKLIEFGCDMVQGYHISRPLPASRISKLIHNAYLDNAEKSTNEPNLTVIKGNHNP